MRTVVLQVASAASAASIGQEIDDDLLADTSVSDFDEILGNVSRWPGELSPEACWTEDVCRRWWILRLKANVVQHLKSHGLSDMPAVVEKLFAAAMDCAGAAESVIRVDLERSRVVLQEIRRYAVTREQAVLFDAFRHHIGHEFRTSFPKIRGKYPQVFGPNDKLTTYTKDLPTQLKAIVIAKRGNAGVWLDFGKCA